MCRELLVPLQLINVLWYTNMHYILFITNEYPQNGEPVEISFTELTISSEKPIGSGGFGIVFYCVFLLSFYLHYSLGAYGLLQRRIGSS